MLQMLKSFILKAYGSDQPVHSKKFISIGVVNLGVKNVQRRANDEEFWSWIIDIDLSPLPKKQKESYNKISKSTEAKILVA